MSEDVQPLLGAQPTSPTSNGGSPSGLTILQSTLSFINLCGVLPIITLPRSVIDCGWMGLPLALVVFGIQIYTAILLGRTWIIAETVNNALHSKVRYPYAALTEEAFGSRLGKLVSIILNLNVFGSGIPNLIIVSQNLQLLFTHVAGNWMDISYCYWLVAIGVVLCPFMWLSSPKEMKCVSLVSVCAVVCVAGITCIYMVADPTTPVSTVTSSSTWEALAITYGILSFQFGVHPMVLTIQMDMVDKRNVGISVCYSFLVMVVLFLATTLTAMFKYGIYTQHNILEGLPSGLFLYCDILLVTLQICLSMVLGGSAMFQDIENRLGVPSEFGWSRCVVRSIIIALAVLVGEFLPRFDLIMGLIGGALSSPLVFFLPPLLYCRFRNLQTSSSDSAPSEELSHASTKDSSVDDLHLPHLSSTNEENPAQSLMQFFNTIKSGYFSIGKTNVGSLSRFEVFIMGTIMFLGVFATASAIYFSIRNAILYTQYNTPACL